MCLYAYVFVVGFVVVVLVVVFFFGKTGLMIEYPFYTKIGSADRGIVNPLARFFLLNKIHEIRISFCVTAYGHSYPTRCGTRNSSKSAVQIPQE